MKVNTLFLAPLLILSACASIGHLGGPNPCVRSIMQAKNGEEVQNVLEGMGIERGLAYKTTEALLTSRLTPQQVCDSLKR